MINSTGNDDYFTENDSTTGAYFRMDNGGNDSWYKSENHSLSRINYRKETGYEFEGTNPNATTTTSAALHWVSTSVSLTSSSGFAAGDWINIFRAFGRHCRLGI